VGTLRDELVTELRRLETDVHYTERCHLNSGEQFKFTHLLFGGIAAIASTATAVTVVKELTSVSAILTVIAAIAASIVTFVKPLAIAERHVACGRHLNGLKLRIRQARTLDSHADSGKTDAELRSVVDGLTQQKIDLDSDAPTLGALAFWRTQRKFDKGHYAYED